MGRGVLLQELLRQQQRYPSLRSRKGGSPSTITASR